MRSCRAHTVILALLLGGCTRWEPYLLPTPQPADLPSALRVWSAGTAATQLAEPFVRGDTLYGRTRADTVGLAIASIVRAARPRLDALRTTGAVVGGMATWIALGLAGGGLE